MISLTTRLRVFAALVTLALPFIGAGTALGQNIIAQYTFDTGDPNGNGTMRTGMGYEAQTVDPNATATPISLSSSLPDTGESWIEFTNTNNGPYPTLVLRIPPGGNSRNPIEAVANNQYIQFTVTAKAGFTLNLSSFSLDAARGGDSMPRGFVLLSVDDSGVASLIDSEDVVAGRRPHLETFAEDLSGTNYQGLDKITFRIYTFAASGGSIEYDNITLFGTVQ
jgi:hypothetical protein